MIASDSRSRRASDPSRLDRFLKAKGPAEALAAWLDLGPEERPSADEARRRIALDVARIDRLLRAQVDAILHHPRFQALESSWRGLRLLVEQVPEESDRLARDSRDPRPRVREHSAPQVLVRVLDASWRELARDLERTLEVDQSHVFRKVYDEEIGSPGGLPFCVLLGDYEVAHRPRPGERVDDVVALRSMSHVAAAAFAPFVTAAHPSLFGLDSFAELERPLDLSRSMNPATHPEYSRWESLRSSDDSRFLGLVLPRVSLRRPWDDDPARADRFRYREDASRRESWLWGNAVYAFGTVLVRSFCESGWLAAIRGTEGEGKGGGLVDALPQRDFETDSAGLAPRGVVEVQVTDTREKELADLGFVPLCHLPGTPHAAFYSVGSLQRPQRYASGEADASSKLSAMLHYVLCASRFAHYLKVIGRDAVGAYATPAEIERKLNEWLLRYTADAEDMSPERRKSYPLAEGRAEVREDPRRPGVYATRFYLRPQFQIDEMATTVTLRTEIVPRAEGRR